MAACGFGSSGLKTTNFDLVSWRPKLSSALRCLKTRKFVQFDGLVLSSSRSRKALIGCQSYAQSAANSEDKSEITKSSGTATPLIPNSLEVESLLTVLCDTTSIAEFELKLGGFRLYVSRNLAEQSSPPSPSQPSLPAPVVAHSVAEAPDNSNGSALALSNPVPSLTGVQTLLDKAADEGLVILQSPKVGYFRRSRTIKGKRAPPSCKEKDTVKEGQVLCYIDQLGGEIPIESDTSGEVVKILRQDGDPVGYGDALIAILPSFHGIKKLQ